MLNIAICLIAPDFNYPHCKPEWDKAVERAELNWLSDTDIQPCRWNDKWALGYLMQQKLGRKYGCQIFLLRCVKDLNKPFEVVPDNGVYWINCQFDQEHGHLMHKTLVAFRLLHDKYDYIVRGNINCIINYPKLITAVNDLYYRKVYTSPLFDGGGYCHGYFILLSHDVCQYIIYHTKNEWFTEPHADDYCIRESALEYCHATTWVSPYGKATYREDITVSNKYAFHASQRASTDSIIEELKGIDPRTFVFRIRELPDGQFIKIYKYLLANCL